MHTLNSNETQGEKTTQEWYVLFWTIPKSSTFQHSCCTATYLPSIQTVQDKLIDDELLNMDVSVLAD